MIQQRSLNKLVTEMKLPESALSVSSHPLIETDRIMDAISSSNSSSYTWVGNHWINPPGVPTFTPQQMFSYFSKRNVLFVGDSTGRRAYGTMLGMMVAANKNDISVEEIDSKAVIDKGKKSEKSYCEVPVDVKYPRSLNTALSSNLGMLCHDLNNGNHNTDNATSDTMDKNHPIMTSGRFDYIRAACFTELHDIFDSDKDMDTGTFQEFKNETSSETATLQKEEEEKRQINRNVLHAIKEEYDMVVILMGVWDIIRNKDCTPSSLPNINRRERLKIALDSLKKHASEKLLIAFRTTGFSWKTTPDPFWELIHDSNEYFQNVELDKTHSDNMVLIDWGSSLFARSYRPNRIEGDMAPHYGLEARTLFAQQLMHELVKVELKSDITVANEPNHRD